MLPLLHQKKQKTMVIQEKWEEGWASLKHVLHPSTHDSFLARIVCLIWGNILSSRQIVTCKQHFLVTTFFCKSNALSTCCFPSCHCQKFCISKATSTFLWAESTKRVLPRWSKVGHGQRSGKIFIGDYWGRSWGGEHIYIYKYSGIHLPSNRWAIHHEQKYCPCGWEILFVAPSSAWKRAWYP